MEPADVLIVEDEVLQREMLRDFLANQGHRVDDVEDGRRALSAVRRQSYDLILLDFKMPGMDGLELLRQIRDLNPEVDAVMMTAYGTVDGAVEAMKAGASDYITKPIDLNALCLVVERVMKKRRLLRENEALRTQLRARRVDPDAIRYRSRSMTELVNLAAHIAPSESTVFIQGETGTGKELFARLVHQLSRRSSQSFVALNCAAIPENLLESELFGHEKGAFTGAQRRRIGHIEQARGGTLFLDEIGEMSLSAQVKLLRFLQERTFQRVGGNQTIQADVRILSATHRDLEEQIREGAFREDLFYRINVVKLKIPPLRERREDIVPLIDHFVELYGQRNHKRIDGLTRQARDLLLQYTYPGNVRELENLIERAVVISRDPILGADLFSGLKPAAPHADEGAHRNLKGALESLEQRMVAAALKTHGGNQSAAARELGISERMLRYKLNKYGLRKNHHPRA